ncbi:hypothetical protein CJ030_MR5G003488 [Morella rubra]|uniref:Uncharacterized protein n=1 Tax=Morella rubra TaxID=262757 RepID=A0A6A1VKK3_9ROSI|nr:hypothetical protein CJ030_MR5G003496 [Morella rubra]KAB1213442.1 hypothetical protein CJ030_MR5G003488 [Morella rubra]
MLPQQHNPSETTPSLQQQIGFNVNSVERDIQSFSIRQYVLASRQKDILISWPFPEKYLRICFKHGIRDVLPPFEPHSSAIQSLRQGVRFKSSKQDNDKADSLDSEVPCLVEEEKLLKNECDAYSYEEISKVSSQDSDLSLISNSCKLLVENDHLTSDSASDVLVPTVRPSTGMPSLHLNVHQNSTSWISSKTLRHKRKRRKGQHKKRSMVDILSAAKNCTLEELYRINRILGCGPAKPPEQGGEGNERLANIEYNCESELTNESLEKNIERNNCEALTTNALRDKRWAVKFKFGGPKPH